MNPWWWALFAAFAVVAFGGNFLFAYLRKYRVRWQPEGAAEAVRIVWVEAYGLDWETRPAVIWERTADGTFMLGQQRVGGYAQIPGACHVGWADGWTFSQSALAHELWHAALQKRGADTIDHSDPGFKSGGLVEQAVRLLVAWQPMPNVVIR